MTVACRTDLPPRFDGIEAVCFDAFGTLVEIADRQQPFRYLFKARPPEKRRELARKLLREDRQMVDWPEVLGAEVTALAKIEALGELTRLYLFANFVSRMSEASKWFLFPRIETRSLEGACALPVQQSGARLYSGCRCCQ